MSIARQFQQANLSRDPKNKRDLVAEAPAPAKPVIAAKALKAAAAPKAAKKAKPARKVKKPARKADPI
jgi:hypothetical protein